MKRKPRFLRGQALAEAALVLVPLVFLAMLGVNGLMLHRARTAATAAAYACAQYVTQYPHRPQAAAAHGQAIAEQVVSGAWSALGQTHFRVSPVPGGPGEFARCSVRYEVRLLFAPPGLQPVQGNTIRFYGAGERWQGRW